MAKKDTLKALQRRGVSDEVSAVLLTKYGSMSDIAGASVDDLTDLGLTEEAAEDVLSKIGKRKATTPKVRKEEEEEEIPAPAEPLEEVSKPRILTDTQSKIESMAEELGIEIPPKVCDDIADHVDRVNTAKASRGESELSEETIKLLLMRAEDMYRKRQMNRNESAGVMAAHSIGEPGTQMNMRTFHFAGVANINITQGLPRLIEIVDARRVPSTPSMTIPLIGTAAEDERVARSVASNIEETCLEDVADLIIDTTNMRLIVVPDRSKMRNKGIEEKDLIDRLKAVKAIKGMLKTGKETRTSSDNYTGDIEIESDEPSYKRLQLMYDAVKKSKIKGIKDIKRALLQKDKETGKWQVVTEGSNLKEVLRVEGVDAKGVTTNSIQEIAEVLGIEAARQSIIAEAGGTLGEAGLNVDIRHIMLVADLMTNDGYVKAIGRHGVSGKKSSVLARAAFEITAAHLLHAAMVGDTDPLEGVTENIIVGQPVTLGTGAVNLIYTPNKRNGDDMNE